ncbi:MAG: UDP-glucose 4-epimerase GalE [Hyphomicrobiales bacterium]|nr:UDP-glucose 4-epimerase GalE [Hyphomicrobiales bacterium]
MRVLITGGAGFIGSQTLLQLLGEQHEICVLDNYSNSSPMVFERVAMLSNSAFELVEGDVRDRDTLAKIFEGFRPEAVIHFAGLKAVGESTTFPIRYYENNMLGTATLLQAMDAVQCRQIVFSSSATVYGVPKYLPYDEAHPCIPTSPYGRTKYFIEEMIRDWSAATPTASAVILRYFNPVGAHSSGIIGEDPNDIPNNLMPYISQVAVGKLSKLQVFGNDYDTRDGTGLRDYIHVVDLARAHLNSIDYVAGSAGVETFNIGTGEGATVLEVIQAFEAASGQTIPYEINQRRPGDIAAFYANPAKAHNLLDWRAKFNLANMCRDAWNWQSKNPDGYVQGPK